MIGGKSERNHTFVDLSDHLLRKSFSGNEKFTVASESAPRATPSLADQMKAQVAANRAALIEAGDGSRGASSEPEDQDDQ